MPVTKIQCATFLLVASAAIGCGEPYGPGPFALPPGKPINGVTVYAGSHFQFAEVGDTAHVRAYGYHDGQGIWAESVTSATWSPSDPTMLRIVRTVNRGNGSTATLIGERPGVVVLSVQLNGVTDADTIRVLPRIARIQLKATRTTVAIGDTAGGGATVTLPAMVCSASPPERIFQPPRFTASVP